MQFEWDPAKAKLNWSKHGVSFAEAISAALDPHGMTYFDVGHSQTEEREVTLGLNASGRILFVVHTLRERHENGVVRIISARRASRRETMLYLSERGNE